MIASKKIKPHNLPETKARILAVAIDLEGNMLDIHSRAISKKMVKSKLVTHNTLLDHIHDLVVDGLLESMEKDRNGLPYYRVTQAGYARAGVKPPLWVA